jgi:hypothetical protein
VGESALDACRVLVGWKSATWPSHGLPRGTPGLANEGYVKVFWGPGDSNPGPPPLPAPLYQPPTIGPPHITCYVSRV